MSRRVGAKVETVRATGPAHARRETMPAVVTGATEKGPGGSETVTVSIFSPDGAVLAHMDPIGAAIVAGSLIALARDSGLGMDAKRIARDVYRGDR